MFAGFSSQPLGDTMICWDAALTYKGDVGEFAYLPRPVMARGTDPSSTPCAESPFRESHCSRRFQVQVGGDLATVMHKPSGLYVYGGYGWQQIDGTCPHSPVAQDDSSTTWFIQPGIEKKWMPLGKTTDLRRVSS